MPAPPVESLGLEKRLHVGLVYWDPFTTGGVQSQVAGRIANLGMPDGPVRYTLFSKQPAPEVHPWPHVATHVFSGIDKFSIAVSEYTASRQLLRTMREVHARDPFDLIDLHAGGAGPVMRAWTRRGGPPYLFVSHSARFATPFSDVRWEVGRFYHWSSWRGADGARRVVAVSQAVKDQWVELGIPADKIIVQHTAIDPFVPAAGGLKDRVPGRLELLYVGRTTRDKGLDLLLDAVALCRAKPGLDLRLSVVGQIDPQHPLRLRATRDSLPVEFLGKRSNADARSLMAEVDVLVVPSRYDPCPVVAIEGLNAGALVLGARAGGLPEQIRDRETGLLVDPDSAPALAQAIAEVAAAGPAPPAAARSGPDRRQGLSVVSKGARNPGQLSGVCRTTCRRPGYLSSSKPACPWQKQRDVKNLERK